MIEEKNEDYNGDSPGAKDAVEQFDDGDAVNVALPQYTPEQINAQLLEEIHSKLVQINPSVFKDIVSELAQLLQEFRDNLSQFDFLQFTAPEAYENLLAVVTTTTQLAQLMILSGILSDDNDAVSHAVSQDIQSNVQEAAVPSAQGEDSAPKADRTVPIGTIRWVTMPDGTRRPRQKQPSGEWKYVSRGANATVGRPQDS